VIRDVVDAADRDLRGQVAPGALGEMLHRLVSYRLQQHLDRRPRRAR
jgi:hypothetical protein